MSQASSVAQREDTQERGLARFAQKTAAWTEKWFPDAYVFALAGVVVVAVAALANGSSPKVVVSTFGDGFWNLAEFTLQMAMVVLTGYVVASSAAGRPGHRADRPRALHGARRGRLRDPDVVHGLAAQLGPEPGLQRPARPGHRPPRRPARRLPGAGRCGVHGPRRGLGARPLLVGRAAAGHPRLADPRAAEDHRRPRLQHHDLHLAVAADGRGADRAERRRRLPRPPRGARRSAPPPTWTSTSTTPSRRRGRAPARASGSSSPGSCRSWSGCSPSAGWSCSSRRTRR